MLGGFQRTAKVHMKICLLIDYQKAYDHSKSPVAYIAESIALSAVFISITYYAKRAGLALRRRKGDK